MQQRSSPTVPHRDVDYRLFVPLFLHAFAVQTMASMVRVTTSYRAVELGLSEIWLGLISGAFALLPIFIAVGIGRYVDKGNDARSIWIGSWLLFVSCIGFRVTDALAHHLLAMTALFGVGYLYLMIAHQMLAVRCSNDRSRETVFGNYMVANAAGQGLGPLIVGWVGGAAHIPPTRFLFGLTVVMTVLILLISLFITPAPRQERKTVVRTPETTVRTLLRAPAMTTLLVASVITVTAQDLVVIYLPVLGAERGIDVATVGYLLMLRATTAVVARVFYAPIIRAVGRTPLTVLTMLVGAAAFVLIVVPLPIAVLYLAVTVIGFALGIAATLSISNVVDIAPSNARGVALSLRITGNRVGQLVIPTIAGIIAAATGAGGIFACVSLSLIASGISVHLIRNGKTSVP